MPTHLDTTTRPGVLAAMAATALAYALVFFITLLAIAVLAPSTIAQPVAELDDPRLSEKPDLPTEVGMVGTPEAATKPSIPGWADIQLPDDPATTEAPVSYVSPPDTPTDPNPVPLDGGLGLLALSGAGYAIRRLRKTPEEA